LIASDSANSTLQRKRAFSEIPHSGDIQTTNSLSKLQAECFLTPLQMRVISNFYTLIFGVPLLLIGCSNVPISQERTADYLRGCWYGEDYQPLLGSKASWLMNRKKDGTFSIEFRTVTAGERLPVQTESGDWKFENGRYITITKVVAGKDVTPYYVDEYEIKSFASNEMVYFHAGVKQEFSSKKVSCDYRSP